MLGIRDTQTLLDVKNNFEFTQSQAVGMHKLFNFP